MIMCLICMATAMVMYLPFLKAYEKQLLEQEHANAAARPKARRSPHNSYYSEVCHGIRRTGNGYHHQRRAVA
ncbi:PTS system protein [Klebsiella michiganensis]|uniref:PTS system protein n=1 Tax=Klebsiella michiganensis TaxID=1134687 RepID=A0A7H4MT98_9ENTR|nr:PTS system protein [Klebsiella michiganensis]